MKAQLIRYNTVGFTDGTTIIALPGQTINADGSIDYSDNYSLEADGTLYDSNDNTVASDVISYDPNKTIVTYEGGNTETIAQINAGGAATPGTPATSFLTGNTPLYIGIGLIVVSFFIKD